MADNLEWTFGLIDRASGPAAKISDQLAKVNRELTASKTLMAQFERQAAGLRTVERVFNRVPLALQSAGSPRLFARIVSGIGNAFGPRAARGVLATAGALSKADDGLRAVGLSLGRVVAGGAIAASVGIAAVGYAISKLADLAMSAGTKLATLAFNIAEVGIKFAVQSMSFRENTLLGLSAMLKSTGAAKNVYDSAVKLAAVTPFETKDVVDIYSSLVGFGFKPTELERVTRAVGDIAAARGMNVEVIRRISLAMGQIKGKGRLQAEELMQLAEAGLGMEKVYAELSPMMGGKTVGEIQKLQEAGKIKSDMAIEAIVRAIEGQFGGVMDQLSTSLSGVWSTLISRPYELVDRAAARSTGISTAYENLKSIVSRLADVFDPASPTGSRIVRVINSLGISIASALPSGARIGKFADDMITAIERATPGMKKLIEDIGVAFDRILPKGPAGMEAIINAMVNLPGYIIAFGQGFATGLEPILTKFGTVFSGNIEQNKAGLAEMGRMAGEFVIKLGEIVIKFGEGVFAVARLIDEIERLSGVILSIPAPWDLLPVTGPVASAWNLGKNLVDGISRGIEAGRSLVAGTTTSVMDEALASAQSAGQIQSPSRLFRDKIGMQLALGIASGIGDGAAQINSAVTGAISPGGLDFGGAVGGGMRIGTIAVSAPIHLAGGDTETKEAAERAVERMLPIALGEALERLAMELGYT